MFIYYLLCYMYRKSSNRTPGVLFEKSMENHRFSIHLTLEWGSIRCWGCIRII